MDRSPDFDIPGVAQHVVQRGRGRGLCFLDAADRVAYLESLRRACVRHGCALHAYVLMDRHVQLLVTPSVPGAVLRMMRMLSREYTRHSYARHGRREPVWERRYAAHAVTSDTEVLAWQRHVELGPVRAWVVDAPCAYRWSSHGANAHGDADLRVTPHSAYLRLGATMDARRVAYRASFSTSLPNTTAAAMRVSRAIDAPNAWTPRVARRMSDRLPGVRYVITAISLEKRRFTKTGVDARTTLPSWPLVAPMRSRVLRFDNRLPNGITRSPSGAATGRVNPRA